MPPVTTRLRTTHVRRVLLIAMVLAAPAAHADCPAPVADQVPEVARIVALPGAGDVEWRLLSSNAGFNHTRHLLAVRWRDAQGRAHLQTLLDSLSSDTRLHPVPTDDGIAVPLLLCEHQGPCRTLHQRFAFDATTGRFQRIAEWSPWQLDEDDNTWRRAEALDVPEVPVECPPDPLFTDAGAPGD